jgi:endonuclease I/chitodextrinase/predicted transcriptional regulator
MKKYFILFTLFLSGIISAQQAYYDDVDLTAEKDALKENLATITIAKHTNILTYNERHNYLYEADADLNNSNNVRLIYTSESRDKREYLSGGNTHNPQTFNTEHVYPQSLITNTAIGDLHHLRVCDTDVNGARGNNPFADSSGSYSNLGSSWYPGDEWKGDVARMIMYLHIRYNESFNDVGTLSLFLNWNAEDPVSNFELQRNEVISSAQGNRNPFIDNPYLATRIWEGTPAEDRWGIYTSNDTEAPTVPADVSLNNITITTIDVSWTASEDNEAVSKYEVFANDTFNGETNTTNYTATGLNANTSYAITVLAKDIANNQSEKSLAVDGTTLIDSAAPTVPTSISVSNQAGTSFRVNWTKSTDDSNIVSYEVYVDNDLNGTTANTNYDVTGLSISTVYSIQILAKDTANNRSAKSNAIDASTTDGTSNVSELFFSEYVEGSGENKALEIVNITGNNINLSPYSIKRQSNGVWETPLQLAGTIFVNDVYVIINSATNLTKLHEEKDLEFANSTPMNFNGDDRVGLYKNDVLIDIIGDLNGTDVFARNITLRRNTDVIEPSIDYSEQREWSYYNTNEVSDIGNFNGTLSSNKNIITAYKLYPNPTSGNIIYLQTTENTKIVIYDILGKKVHTSKVTVENNDIDISKLSKGVFIVKMTSDTQMGTRKFIKN